MMAGSQFEIRVVPNPLALAPRPRAILRLLGGEHAEFGMPFAITGDLSGDRIAVGAVGARVELRATAAESLAAARLLRAAGHANVRITDADTGEPCDEAEMAHAAEAEGG